MCSVLQLAIKVISFHEQMCRKCVETWPWVAPKLQLIKPAIEIKEEEINFNFKMKDFSIPIPDRSKIFLLVAGLRPVKDPIYLVDLFQKWHRQDRKIYLLVVGPELDKECANQLKTKIQEAEGVVYHPELSQPDLFGCLLQSFALVNTSVSEGCSNIILESFCLQKPVLARKNEGNESLVKDHETGFLYETPDQFLFIAKKLLADELNTSNTTDNTTTLLKKVVKNAKQFFDDNFQPEREKLQYLSLLEKIK
eukprot:TRINITY_DN6041_c0_g1_i1.p1 TRINITY_DN6041_c0_g1~~TRINITY_DN6041_c0_g1_i1.p1  ORF type:complete len:282 (-),score=88.45 TRINITY_DN6041_c0_g1_i1:13-768(-)